MEKNEQSQQLDMKNTNIDILEDAKRRYDGEMSDEELLEKYPTKSQRAAFAVNVMALIEEDEKREREKRNLLRKDIAKNRKEFLTLLGEKCFICDFDFYDLLHIHHKVRLKDGGSNEIENLVLLCPNCHSLLHYFEGSFSSETPPGYDNNLRFLNLNDWMDNNLTLKQVEKISSLFTILMRGKRK
jgi:predicted restriction endonuclease